MMSARRSGNTRRGQSTVEYLLVISVLVIAIWSTAQVFVPGWRNGLRSATGDIQNMARDGYVGGGEGATR